MATKKNFNNIQVPNNIIKYKTDHFTLKTQTIGTNNADN